MSSELPVPETRVLAVASHVLHGYVGNTAAVLVMQSQGCEVAALNTVQYSNHVGYRQFTGTRTSASEITDLFKGLQQSNLSDFDMLLTGYVPGAEAVTAVGKIGRELKLKGNMRPGSFFWIMDPVMGDNGKLYVSEEVVPVYKDLLRECDLVLPNQYEAEWLSGIKITDMKTLTSAISTIHTTYRTPHILITSVRLPSAAGSTPSLRVIGSTATSTLEPRIFQIEVPSLDCFFSGTGDMFAALILVRLRSVVSSISDLLTKASWISEDDVESTELPLAKAAECALASMQELLTRTKVERDRIVEAIKEDEDEKVRHLITTRAAEVRLVRNLECLGEREIKYRAEKVEV